MADYDRAQHLHETVANRLKHVDEQTEKHGPKHPRLPSPGLRPADSVTIADLSRNPEAVRQAFIASLIFGCGVLVGIALH